MLEISIELPLHFKKWIVEYIQALILSLENQLAITIDAIDNDHELAFAWADSLSSDINFDNQSLLNFISNPVFGQSPITITVVEAEHILRASAALRLKIQQNLLKNVTDQAIEEGEVNIEELNEKEMHAYQCYVFLAALQIAILEAIDPNLKTI